MTTPSPRSRLHRIDLTLAAWGEEHTYFVATAWCGLTTRAPHLHIEPPDAELCDECVFADGGPHVVYRFFGAQGDLLYIGYSGVFHRRIGEHRRSSSWWHKVRSCTYEIYEDEPQARAAEFRAIQVENPRHNRKSGPVPRKAAA